MVEEVSAQETVTGDENEKDEGIQIRQVFRYAIQIVTNIEDTGSRLLKFLKPSIQKDEEKQFLNVDVENIGERMLYAICGVELYDENGNHIRNIEGGTRRLYPDTSARFPVDLTDIETGKYKALVIQDCGGDDVFGAMYTLMIE